MLIAVIGDLGSGKTLFLTLMALLSKREVLANFKINIPNYKYLDVMDLMSLGDNKDVFIDEMYTWLESRVSSSFLNRYVSYIMFQSRKRTIDIYGSMQLFSSIDLRFRNLVNKLVKCTRIRNKERSRDLWDFHYEIMDLSTTHIKGFILRYDRAKEYFKYFDTYEIVEPYNKKKMEVELLKNNPKEMINRIEEIAEKIRKKLENVTHASVRIALMKEGYDVAYEQLVYSLLKYDNHKT